MTEPGIQIFQCHGCEARYRTIDHLKAHLSACAPVLASDAYSELRRVLDLAHDQASRGKGKDRHATEGERFEDQQIVQLGAWMRSNHFELGQACKKLIESTRLKPGPAKHEILGAINYAVAAYLLLEQDESRDSILGQTQGEG